MTNTHVNFGGHKITTNKVGTVHNITLTSNFSLATGNPDYKAVWYVVNRVCYLVLWGLIPAAQGTSQILNSSLVPKAKEMAITVITNNTTTLNGCVYIGKDTTIVRVSIYSSDLRQFYSTLIYPVADDWNE